MIRWGSDCFILERQAKRSTAYIDLPPSFDKYSVKDKLAVLAATVQHNKKTLESYLRLFAKMPKNARMYRIPNLCFPLFFNRSMSWLWRDIDYKAYFADIGKFCRKHKIRISIHSPMNVYVGIDTVWNWYALNRMGQLFREMGYTEPYQDGTCFCVHSTFNNFAPEELNEKLLTNVEPANLNYLAVENTHTAGTLLNNLQLSVAKIVDLHHLLISDQKYLKAESNIWSKVKRSWGDARPKIHLSVPTKQAALVDGDTWIDGRRVLENRIPADMYDHQYVKHADFIWGRRYLNWARTFDADIMIEASWCHSATNMARYGITSIEELDYKNAQR